MNRKAILAIPLALAACATPNGPPNPNEAACLSALMAAGMAGGINAIPMAAATTPACLALAADVLQQIIGQASTTTAANRRAMGLRP